MLPIALYWHILWEHRAILRKTFYGILYSSDEKQQCKVIFTYKIRSLFRSQLWSTSCLADFFSSFFLPLLEQDWLVLNTQPTLIVHVADLNVWIVKFYKLGPVRLVLGNGKIKPRLVVSVVVNHSCVLDLRRIYGWIITEAQNMPTSIKGICQVVESYQTRRQCPELPKLAILVLQIKWILLGMPICNYIETNISRNKYDRTKAFEWTLISY